MKILLAPNAFKGCLSAREFCSCAAFLSAKHTLEEKPFSDGGDSILEVFSAAFKTAKTHHIYALNAIGKKHISPYLLLADGKTCIIETAKICGLGELKKSELDIENASSYGIGQVIKAAYKKGARVFYIGLGGVAFNDGGAGMAAALGYKFLDENGKTLPLGAAALRKLKTIKKPKRPLNIKVYGLSDVENKLLGPLGSAAVYGPQKGAAPEQVVLLEEAMARLYKTAKTFLGININTKHCGAAGALGAGLKGFLGGELRGGAAFIAKKIKLAAAVKKADLIITGEGKLDGQTFYGKGPFYLCKLAEKYKKPVIFICGTNALPKGTKLPPHIKVLELSALAQGQEDSIKNARFYLEKTLTEKLSL